MNDNNLYNENLASGNAYEANNNGYENWEDDYVAPQTGSGLAITGMVLGIVSLVFIFLLACCSPLVGGLVAMPFAIAGLIVSIIGKKKGQSNGMCIAGIICSAVSLVIGVVLIIIMIISFVLLGTASVIDTMDYYNF